METNENDYDTAGEDHEPLQEPHPEPGDEVSERYEDESSQYTNSNSRTNSRALIDDSFDRANANEYQDYLQDDHGEFVRSVGSAAGKDIAVVEFGKKEDDE
jgi:hypothetical protein